MEIFYQPSANKRLKKNHNEQRTELRMQELIAVCNTFSYSRQVKTCIEITLSIAKCVKLLNLLQFLIFFFLLNKTQQSYFSLYLLLRFAFTREYYAIPKQTSQRTETLYSVAVKYAEDDAVYFKASPTNNERDILS